VTKSSVSVWILAAFGFCLGSSASFAQQNDSVLKNVMKLMGFATDTAPPADFVQQSRPKGDLNYIPVFQPPPEPARPRLEDKQLQSVRNDLDSLQKRDDALRQAFPPAAKAVAEEAAAKKAKAKPAAPVQ
jgi:hypothetical protein